MKAREIGAAVLNAKDDEEMTRLIHSMTDYQKEIMIKTLVSIVKKAHEVCEHYKSKGIDVKFEMNPGNHMTDIDERVAKGIASLLLGW